MPVKIQLYEGFGIKKKWEAVFVFCEYVCVCVGFFLNLLKYFPPDFALVNTVLTFLFCPVSRVCEVFLQVPDKKTWSRITLVTWQSTRTSLVTCRRSGFRKLLFYVRKQNSIKSRLPPIPIGQARQSHRCHWWDCEHVRARQNQTPALLP